jgi:hypothetical protein
MTLTEYRFLHTTVRPFVDPLDVPRVRLGQPCNRLIDLSSFYHQRRSSRRVERVLWPIREYS